MKQLLLSWLCLDDTRCQWFLWTCSIKYFHITVTQCSNNGFGKWRHFYLLAWIEIFLKLDLLILFLFLILHATVRNCKVIFGHGPFILFSKCEQRKNVLLAMIITMISVPTWKKIVHNYISLSYIRKNCLTKGMWQRLRQKPKKVVMCHWTHYINGPSRRIFKYWTSYRINFHFEIFSWLSTQILVFSWRPCDWCDENDQLCTKYPTLLFTDDTYYDKINKFPSWCPKHEIRIIII